MNRETWLNALADKMASRFADLGYPLPKFRVAVGWTSAGKTSKVGSECWHSSSSADRVFEILVAPILDDSMKVAAVLAHELTHAAVGFKHKHRGEFAKVMKQLGMLPPMTSSVPGADFEGWVAPFIEELGNIPHARILLQPQRQLIGEDGDGEGEDGEGLDDEGGSSNAKKKQTTRLIKCECETCGYTVRTTAKWLEKGAPHCPDHGEMKVAE